MSGAVLDVFAVIGAVVAAVIVVWIAAFLLVLGWVKLTGTD